jgi:hypothetical protein
VTMTPGTRKFFLTTHIVCSVGWLGSVAAFLALAVWGLKCGDLPGVRAAYLSMDVLGWWIIVPLCFASLVTGLIQSLGTEWGLFRHYWVLLKLAINLLCTLLLLLHMGPIGYMAKATTMASFPSPELQGLRIQLIVEATGAVLALLTATALSVYKPKGMTPYGWRRLQ